MGGIIEEKPCKDLGFEIEFLTDFKHKDALNFFIMAPLKRKKPLEQ